MAKTMLVSCHRSMRVAEGANYSLEVDEGVATLRVWKRPDLSFDEGARLAVEILGHVRRLAGEREVGGFVMDLREAPALTGKRTRTVLGNIVAASEAADKPIGVVLTDVQRATIAAALLRSGPTRARLYSDPEAARSWAAGRT